MEDMYKQAILDAKAVRASAMANAKATLQEAFEPKIQEMIRLKLSEELEELDEELDEVDPQDEPSNSQEDTAYKTRVSAGKTGGSLAEDEYEMDEASLEEILAELDELAKTEEDEGAMMEAEDDDKKEDDDASDDASDDSTDDSEATEEAPTDDTKVIDITLGDLKQVLQSIQGGDTGMEDLGGDDESGSETDDESGDDEDENIDLQEILDSLEEAKDKDMKKKDMKEKKEEKDETKESLKEAVKTINILRKELNEVNLLNAKLLYMNKIFKSKNLSESQKVNVVSALDRASNTKEAKNIYETLKENISQKKSQIQESRGFASKPAGVAPKKPILESDAFVSRWQKIAGIK